MVYSQIYFLLSGVSVMDANVMPKFASKDEEIDFWKALSLKYKKR